MTVAYIGEGAAIDDVMILFDAILQGFSFADPGVEKFLIG
jgi:hypothetical protein